MPYAVEIDLIEVSDVADSLARFGGEYLHRVFTEGEVDTAFALGVRRVAENVAAAAADTVDREARFPHEAIEALREMRALSAFVPSPTAEAASGSASSPAHASTSVAAAPPRGW